jgi:hypothetical protein
MFWGIQLKSHAGYHLQEQSGSMDNGSHRIPLFSIVAFTSFPSLSMSLRPRLKKNQPRPPALTAAAYRLTPVATPGTQRRNSDKPLVILPNGRMLTQNPALPRLPGQVGLRGERPVNLDDIAGAGTERRLLLPAGPGEQVFFDGVEPGSPSKHRAKRLRQWERWTTDILPLIIPAYIELQRTTRSFRDEAVINVDIRKCECCQTARKLSIWVYRFSSKFSFLILVIH